MTPNHGEENKREYVFVDIAWKLWEEAETTRFGSGAGCERRSFREGLEVDKGRWSRGGAKSDVVLSRSLGIVNMQRGVRRGGVSGTRRARKCRR